MIPQDLIDAVKDNDANKASEILKSNSDINVNENLPLNNGVQGSYNLLFKATLLNNPELVSLLLEYGANPDLISTLALKGLLTTRTSLAMAVEKGFYDAASILIARGATVDKTITENSETKTPLSIAVSIKSQEMASLLLEHGANPDQTIKVKQNHEETPLIIAVMQDNPSMVSLLLEHGANPNKTIKCNENRHSPLSLATEKEFTNIASLLLENGAEIGLIYDPNARFTALIQAAQLNLPSMVRFLLENGANPLTEDKDGHNAEAWAMRHESQESLKFCIIAMHAFTSINPTLKAIELISPEAATKLKQLLEDNQEFVQKFLNARSAQIEWMKLAGKKDLDELSKLFLSHRTSEQIEAAKKFLIEKALLIINKIKREAKLNDRENFFSKAQFNEDDTLKADSYLAKALGKLTQKHLPTPEIYTIKEAIDTDNNLKDAPTGAAAASKAAVPPHTSTQDKAGILNDIILGSPQNLKKELDKHPEFQHYVLYNAPEITTESSEINSNTPRISSAESQELFQRLLKAINDPAQNLEDVLKESIELRNFLTSRVPILSFQGKLITILEYTLTKAMFKTTLTLIETGVKIDQTVKNLLKSWIHCALPETVDEINANCLEKIYTKAEITAHVFTHNGMYKIFNYSPKEVLLSILDKPSELKDILALVPAIRQLLNEEIEIPLTTEETIKIPPIEYTVRAPNFQSALILVQTGAIINDSAKEIIESMRRKIIPEVNEKDAVCFNEICKIANLGLEMIKTNDGRFGVLETQVTNAEEPVLEESELPTEQATDPNSAAPAPLENADESFDTQEDRSEFDVSSGSTLVPVTSELSTKLIDSGSDFTEETTSNTVKTDISGVKFHIGGMFVDLTIAPIFYCGGEVLKGNIAWNNTGSCIEKQYHIDTLATKAAISTGMFYFFSDMSPASMTVATSFFSPIISKGYLPSAKDFALSLVAESAKSLAAIAVIAKYSMEIQGHSTANGAIQMLQSLGTKTALSVAWKNLGEPFVDYACELPGASGLCDMLAD